MIDKNNFALPTEEELRKISSEEDVKDKDLFDEYDTDESDESFDSKKENDNEGESEINDYYTRVIRGIPLLTEKEEYYYAKLAKEGNEEEKKLGRDKLVTCNMRYVLKVAGKYQSSGLSYDDLVQEGACGLMIAAERYDYTKGYRFTTYATWWIKQKITRSICDHGRSIRIPVHLHEKLFRLKKAENEVNQMHLNKEEEKKWICEKCDFTKEELLDLYRYRQDAVSLETPIKSDSADDESMIKDFVQDEVSESPEEIAIRENIKEVIRKSMERCLSDREKYVVVKRYGLDGSVPMTLEEVGDTMSITRERVRQIEAKALRKLKNPRNKLHEVL